jgi:hypothetical protein
MMGGINYIENDSVTFTNSDSEVVNLVGSYTNIPYAVLSTRNENVNVFIDSITTTTLTIKLSQKMTAIVDYQIFGTD